MSVCKALSLWQPWASLIAIGAKRIETRHWSAPRSLWGQRIAIHAAKRGSELWLLEEWPFSEYDLEPLPLGAIVATAVIARCTEITELGAAELEHEHPHEYAFGNYEPGRFAWVLRDVERLAEPIPFRGAQGFFDVPAALVDAMPAQQVLR